jgi:hypothetical protein
MLIDQFPSKFLVARFVSSKGVNSSEY